MLLAHEGLDHADAAQVLLHYLIEAVVGLEHALEDGVGVAHDDEQAHGEERRDAEENGRQLRVDEEGHHQRENEHHRGAEEYALAHLEGHLHVGDVRGHAGHEAGGGKALDVGKGEVLHVVIEVVAQVLGVAGGGLRRRLARQRAKQQRDHRAADEDEPHLPDVAHVAGAVVAVDAVVDEHGHQKGDDALHDRLQRHIHRRAQGDAPVFAHAVAEYFFRSQHGFPPSSFNTLFSTRRKRARSASTSAASKPAVIARSICSWCS